MIVVCERLIPSLEASSPLLIQDDSPPLQKAMCMSRLPRHLLPIHKSLANRLVDPRLGEARRGRLAMTVAVPVIHNTIYY
jgi:hypothetical protein